MLNSSEPTLTRVDIHPISSYNIFLDGVLVVEGSCTHEPKDKDRNLWESMKPVTMNPTGPNWFCFGVGGFLNFGVPNVFHMVFTNPFHQVLNCYLLCSQFISHSATLSLFPKKKKKSKFFNGTNRKIHCKTEPVQDDRKGQGEHPTSPTKKHITT